MIESKRWVVGSLAQFEQSFFHQIDTEDQFICLADPSTHIQGPAWSARNLLALAKYRWKLREVQLLCYRESPLHQGKPKSLVFRVESDKTLDLELVTAPKVTGWERNENDKITSRMVNLAEFMDPKRIAVHVFRLPERWNEEGNTRSRGPERDLPQR